MKIAIFYHCLFYRGEPPKILDAAVPIIAEQMFTIRENGLLDAAEYFQAGINGGRESEFIAQIILPQKADLSFHGLDSFNENSTVLDMENWLPGHESWYVLYFHSKGATHPIGDRFTGLWRNCMMRHNVHNWKQCVQDLENGYDAVGCHWMEPPATPEGHYIFAGTFWWARADYLLTLPSIMDRDRIKTSGLKAKESRYETEVWLGMGPRKPKIKDYHGPNWNPSKIESCQT